jgi:septal ring factor EnvC (AmiA/AmiB activator)
LRRIAYLKSYRNYREKQVKTILETQELIARRQQQQISRKNQKNEALQSQVKERSVLSEQRKEKDAVVSKLKSQEKDLQKQIAAKKKRDRDIQNAIAAIIRREIEAAKKAAELKAAEEAKKNEAIAKANPTKPASPSTTTTPKPVVKKNTSYLDLNAEDVRLNNNFEQNKGKIPWPVDNGIPIVHFGPYTVEGTNIRDNNPGVTIATSVGSPVKAVFDGEVAAIHNYGDGAAVVIRHGKYFTSYSNMSGVNVKKGAVVKTGQVIGRAGESMDGASGQIDFMLMIESKNVNPESWLRR